VIHGAVVTHLVRLPLLDDTQLAILTGRELDGVRESLALLRRSGWLFEHKPTTGTRSADTSLIAMSAAGIEQLKRAPDASGMALGALPSWQLQPRSVPVALAGEPVTRIVNAAVTAMASAVRRDGVGDLAFAAHRPASPRAAELRGDSRPMLQWGHVEVRIALGAEEARCALLIDRSRLPVVRRHALLEAWRNEHNGIALILCANEHEQARWLNMSDEQSITRIACALQSKACADYGADDLIWRVPGRRSPRSLRALLSGVSRPGGIPLAPPSDIPEMPEPPEIGTASQARDDLLRTNAASSPWEVVAAAMMDLDHAALQTLRTLAIQWWLSHTDLARVADWSIDHAAEQLRVLQACGLAVEVDSPDDQPRWILTDAALRMVAAHSGEARAWQAHSKALRIPRARADRSPPAPVEHDLGAPRALGLVADAARRAGWMLTDWRTEHWWESEISTQRPVPDAAFVLQDPAGSRVVGILEYERLKGGHQARKNVNGWEQWYADGCWHRLHGGPLGTPAGERPITVIIYDGQSTRRRSLPQALAQAPGGTPLYAIPEEEFAAGGFRAAAWLRAGGGRGSPLSGAAPLDDNGSDDEVSAP
jgi:hypothetical protein